MGYLSRLVRQSGLHAGLTAPRSLVVAPVPAASPAMPLEVDEIRDAPPPGASPFRPLASPSQGPLDATSDPPRRALPDPPRAPRIERDADGVESPSAHRPLDRTPAPTLPVGRVEGVPHEVHATREERPIGRERAEPLPLRARVERVAGHPADPPLAPSGSPSPSPAPPPAAAPRASSAQTFAERLAEVRAWVAAPPPPPAPAEPAEPAEPAAEKVWESRAEAGVHAPAGRPGPSLDVTTLAGAPAEVNHFTLSIGSIQLTVDEPPRPAPAAPAPAPATRAAPLPAASRLGSHYLRA